MYHQEHSSFSIYIGFSIGFHILVASILFLIPPMKQPLSIAKTVTINIGSGVQASVPKPAVLPLAELPKKATSKKIKKKGKTKSITQSKAPVKSTSSVPKETSIPLEKSVSEPINIPVPPSVPKIEDTVQPKESDLLAQELENVLNTKNKPVSSTDFLANASWTGSPRKTIAFPNLADVISKEVSSGHYGYTVTAKITFSPQGWVSSIDIIHSSGDPRIDNIFRNELRKIRIEENTSGNYDTVTKSFNITVK